MKVRAKKLSDTQRMKTLDTLYTAAGTVKGRAAMKLFLRDLLTESERIMLGRRLMIARLILSGKSERDIESELGVGRDTVWKVRRWLHDQFPGFEHAIKDLEQELGKRQKQHENKRLYATSALYRLKKKYPLHFLLFPGPTSKK